MWSYYHWIRNNVAANTPWDEFARALVTATGSTLENGAANFYVLHQDPPELAETVSVAFLGMSINCAKCHNHPLEKWTNDQYYGMANLFARVRSKEAPGEGNRIVYAVSSGELVQPLTGKPQPPRPLDGAALDFADEADRRLALAQWLTAPRTRTSAGRSRTACGRTFSAWGWSKASTTCGSPIRPAMPRCWMPRPTTWSSTVTTSRH